MPACLNQSVATYCMIRRGAGPRHPSRKMPPNVGVADLAAFSSMLVNTGSRSPGKPLMTSSTSDGGRLLLPSFIQFAGKPSDLRLFLSRGRIGTSCGLRRITAFRPGRLATSPFDRFAACSGAPFHRVPRRLRGIVAGRRLTRKWLIRVRLTNRYAANSSSNAFASFRSSVSKPSVNHP